MIMEVTMEEMMVIEENCCGKRCGGVGGCLNVNFVLYFGPSLWHSSLSFDLDQDE